MLIAQNTTPTSIGTETSNESNQEDEGHSLTDDENVATGRFEIMDEIIVQGSRRNVGIRRTENDFQPFVVFGQEEIQQSGQQDLDDFLRTRLPQNQSLVARSNAAISAATGNNSSSINLRGLGADQTLVLVNGRRLPRVFENGNFTQTDVNGIPLSAIERIEVLPATASGIYGGGATGGAINIILRDNYKGVEVGARYDNTFDTDSAIWQLYASGGFSLEGGRTDVLFSASYSDSNELLSGDRDFRERSRQLALMNAPDTILNGSFIPPGSTTNIRALFPSELVLDDGTPLGSNITSVPVGYAGPASDSGAALVENAGVYNLAFPDDASPAGSQQSLANSPEIYSLDLRVNREFSPSLSLYLDTLLSANNGRSVSFDNLNATRFVGPTDPVNPFQNAVLVTYPLVGLGGEKRFSNENVQTSFGFVADAFGDWSVAGDFTWSKSRQTEEESGFPDFAVDGALRDGTIDIFSDLNVFEPDYEEFLLPEPGVSFERENTLRTFSLRGSGPLFTLPGGTASGSVLIERREERLSEGTFDAPQSIDPNDRNRLRLAPASQTVNSFFAELQAPLVGARNQSRETNLLEAVLSFRIDDYETIALLESTQRFLPVGEEDFDLQTVTDTATSTTIGLKYAPFKNMFFRGSYATGVLPPSLSEIQPTDRPGQFLFVLDPERGGTSQFVGPIDLVQGGNPNVKPEQSTTTSFGIVLQKGALPGFLQNTRISIDYVRIKKDDEISAGLDTTTLLLNEERFSDRIERGSLTTEDQQLGFTAGPILFLDLSAINIAQTDLSAIDLQFNYDLQTDRYGEFSFYVVATRNLERKGRLFSGDEYLDSVDFSNGPLKYQGNLGLDWSKANLSLGWNTQYFHSFNVLSADVATDPFFEGFADFTLRLQGRERIPRQLIHNFYARYELRRFDTTLTMGVNNVTNHYESLANNSGLGQIAQPGDPRLRTYHVSLVKRF